MNVLIITEGLFAVSYHRLLTPWLRLNQSGEIKLTVYFTNIHGPSDDIPSFKGLDLVIFNRNISSKARPEWLIARIRRDGASVICDIDDHWIVGKQHVLNDVYKREKRSECQIANMVFSSGITCSTPALRADIYKTTGKKALVVKNCIDPTHEQFDLSLNKHVYDNISYVGGVTHQADLKMLYFGLNGHTFPIVLSGYRNEPVWNDMIKDAEGAGLTVTKEEATGVERYAKVYNNKGICLAPLNGAKFNRFKSELKMVEAGWFSKAMIVSEAEPFSNLARHMENCIVVSQRNNTDWGKAIKLLQSNRRLQDDLRGRLNEDIKTKYNLDNENARRLEYARMVIAKDRKMADGKRNRFSQNRSGGV